MIKYSMTKKIKESLAEKCPELAAQWHPTKNGTLSADDVFPGSSKKVWWYYPYNDPITGKHFDFEWEARIDNRYYLKNGCPFISSQELWTGYNDLQTKNPKLAQEWHPTKNNGLKPTDVMEWSNKKVWWCINYIDERTGKQVELEWEASVNDRSQGKGCPYIGTAPKKILVGFNDLSTTHPKVAAQWDYVKNAPVKPEDIFKGSNKKYHWRREYFDKIKNKTYVFEWEAAPNHRREDATDCPQLNGKKVHYGFNDLETSFPEIAAQWDYKANYPLTPRDVATNSNKKVAWLQHYYDEELQKEFVFKWEATICSRTRGRGCPYLQGNQSSLYKGFNDLATRKPSLIPEWNEVKNGKLTPEDITSGANRSVWWICSKCKHEWKAIVSSRTSGGGCPICNKSSKTELYINDYLQMKGITFIKEHKFIDCRVKDLLIYDFYLPEFNILIEVDGSQHFYYKSKFGSLEEWEKRKRYDNLKNQYCIDEGIPLLRIPYIYNPETKGTQIEELITRFIESSVVPEEIVKYYNRFEFSTYCRKLVVKEKI